MARSIRTFGNKEGASRCVPEAKRLLFLLKDRKKLAGIDSLWDNRYLADGSFVQISSIFNNDYINITSPFIITEGGAVLTNILLYLVTIAIPISKDSDITEYDDYDVDGLHVCKTYAYSLDEESGLLIPDKTEIVLRHNYFTVGGGLTLTMQEGYLNELPDHYAQLSNKFCHEEEIGALDWRAFQAGGGWSLNNPGTPDSNTWYGQSIVRFMKMATYGSLEGLKNPDPTTKLWPSYSARKGYDLSGNVVTHTNFSMQSERIHEEFAPAYWDWERGVAMFVGIIEYLNPNYRFVNKYRIWATNEATGESVYEWIAEDEHELQNYPVQSGLDTSLNWKYHVPIMAVTHDKALMRIVEREGTNKTCWEAMLTEDLVIGKSDYNLNLDKIIYNTNGGLSATSVQGDDTIGANDTKGYDLHGCQSGGDHGDQAWSVAGVGASIDNNGTLTTVAACGVLVVTGTCVSCGLSASKDVLAPGKYIEIGQCIKDIPYCPIGETTYIYEGRYAWGCSTCTHYCVYCGASWNCTGDCSGERCTTCVPTGNLCRQARTNVCYEWGC